ncbi:MAG: hypothetical protein NVSMB68_16270 [Thermoanaerobaculia bacterium]
MKRVLREKGITVSELNLRKTAVRLLGQNLVSPEVQYIQRMLGAKASQQDIDKNVLAVRKLPWASIVLPD